MPVLSFCRDMTAPMSRRFGNIIARLTGLNPSQLTRLTLSANYLLKGSSLTRVLPKAVLTAASINMVFEQPVKLITASAATYTAAADRTMYQSLHSHYNKRTALPNTKNITAIGCVITPRSTGPTIEGRYLQPRRHILPHG